MPKNSTDSQSHRLCPKVVTTKGSEYILGTWITMQRPLSSFSNVHRANKKGLLRIALSPKCSYHRGRLNHGKFGWFIRSTSSQGS